MSKNTSLKDLLSSEDFKPLVSTLSFEDGLRLLEELVQKVESGTLALDKAIDSYERGVALIEALRGQLAGAEEKIKVLKSKAGVGAE